MKLNRLLLVLILGLPAVLTATQRVMVNEEFTRVQG